MSPRFLAFKPHTLLSVLLMMTLFFSTGCATDPKTGAQSILGVKVSSDPCSNLAQTIGTVAGVGVGVILANQFNHKLGTKVAVGALGGMVGNLIGRDIDHRRCELFKIAKKYDLEMSLTDVVIAPAPVEEGSTIKANASANSLSASGVASAEQSAKAAEPSGDSLASSKNRSGNEPSNRDGEKAGLSVEIRDNGHQFESGSAVLTPVAQSYFQEIALQYVPVAIAHPAGAPGNSADQQAADEKISNRTVLLVGHTDDTGSSRLNADLSERRAIAVAEVFVAAGVKREQIFVQGAGEVLPIADNRTEEGRAANRRVQIVDTIDREHFVKYLSSRTQNLKYYRSVASPDAPGGQQPPAKEAIAQDKPAEDVTRSPTLAAAPDQQKSAQRGKSPKPSKKPSKETSGAAVAAKALPQDYDFGGIPVPNAYSSGDIGKPVSDAEPFSLISSAYAAAPPSTPAPNCASDRPRISHGVKALADLKEVAVEDFFPGLYGTSWFDVVNGTLVGFSRVAVYRDGGSPVVLPDFLLIRNYRGDVDAKPDYASKPEVNVYRGDKAVLYRAFVNGPVKCVDLLFPFKNTGSSKPSSLFYLKKADLYVAPYEARVAR